MKTTDVTGNDVNAGLRCAIYKRSACKMQRPASPGEQERHCRDAADQHGWTVLNEYVREDEGLSGSTLLGREALLSLLRDGERTPRPFDVLLVDDTSRLSRNLADVLEITQKLKHCGIRLFAVSQRFDSFDPNFLTALTVLAMVHEPYVKSHR
jgi:site-specific DNA recombinase